MEVFHYFGAAVGPRDGRHRGTRQSDLVPPFPYRLDNFRRLRERVSIGSRRGMTYQGGS